MPSVQFGYGGWAHLAQKNDGQGDDDVHGCWYVEGQAPCDEGVVMSGEANNNVGHDDLDHTSSCNVSSIFVRSCNQGSPSRLQGMGVACKK